MGKGFDSELFREFAQDVLEALARGKARMLGRPVPVEEIIWDMQRGIRGDGKARESEAVRPAAHPPGG